jgi:hypothetical protein
MLLWASTPRLCSKPKTRDTGYLLQIQLILVYSSAEGDNLSSKPRSMSCRLTVATYGQNTVSIPIRSWSLPGCASIEDVLARQLVNGKVARVGSGPG